LLDEKEARWLKRKDDCVERMNELSEIFSGLTTMSRVKKNGNNLLFYIYKLLFVVFERFGRRFITSREYSVKCLMSPKLPESTRVFSSTMHFL